MRMAIVKIHCASLATNKFSVVGVLYMLNWKRPGISLAKQYVGEKTIKRSFIYLKLAFVPFTLWDITTLLWKVRKPISSEYNGN